MCRRLVLDITPQDIARGEPGDECRCAAALCVQELVPQARQIVVCERGVTFVLEGRRRTFVWCDEDGPQFVEHFDEGWQVAPCALELREVGGYGLPPIELRPEMAAEDRQRSLFSGETQS